MTLLAQWKLQDNAASTTVAATVGSNGTLVGGDNTSVLFAAGGAGPGTALAGCLKFNGTDDAVNISSTALTGQFTFAWWQKRATTTSTEAAFGNSAVAVYVAIASNTTAMNIILISGGSTYTPAHGVTTTNWNHYALTRDASNIVKFYVNGSLVNSNVGAGAVSGTVTVDRLGRRTVGFASSYFADLRLYDSDESANIAAIVAEKDSSGSAALLFATNDRFYRNR